MKRTLLALLLLVSGVAGAQPATVDFPSRFRMWPSPAAYRIPYVTNGTTGAFGSSAAFTFDGSALRVNGQIGISTAPAAGTKLHILGGTSDAFLRLAGVAGNPAGLQVGTTNGYFLGADPGDIWTLNRDVPLGTFSRSLLLIDGTSGTDTFATMLSGGITRFRLSGAGGSAQILQLGATSGDGYAVQRSASDTWEVNADSPTGTFSRNMISATRAGSFSFNSTTYLFRATDGGSDLTSRFYLAPPTGAGRLLVSFDEGSSSTTETGIGWGVNNTASRTIRYCGVLGTASNRTAGSEAGYLSLQCATGGAAMTEIVRIDSTGVMLPGLTASSPVLTDASKYLVSGASSVGTPAADPSLMEARLTLTSGVPVTVSDVTAATTVYHTPHVGGVLSLRWSGTWTVYTASQHSLKLTDTQTCTTTNASTSVTGCSDTSQLVRGMVVSGTGVAGGQTISAITSATAYTLSANATASGTVSLTHKLPASTLFDVFVVPLTVSTYRLQFGSAWSTNTAGSGARAITVTQANAQDGVLVNDTVYASGDYNSIAAKAGRYVGTVMTTSTAGQTEDSTANRLVANYWNRVIRVVGVTETTSSWTYTSTSTFRPMRNQTSNCLAVVVPQQDQAIALLATTRASHSATTWDIITGISKNSTTQISSAYRALGASTANTVGQNLDVEWADTPPIGYNYYCPMESSSVAGTQTYLGQATTYAGQTVNASGIGGTWPN